MQLQHGNFKNAKACEQATYVASQVFLFDFVQFRRRVSLCIGHGGETPSFGNCKMTNPSVSSDLQHESHPNNLEIDPFTRCFIRKQARQLVGKRGFSDSDREDIEQQLYVKLTPYLDQADPESPRWKAFVAKTVRRQIVTMIRHNEREMRDHRRASSINVLVVGDDDKPVEMASNLQENQTPGQRGRDCRTEQELAELRIDLNACIGQLDDPRFREFCERLKRDSISQVASDMGVPRTTVNAWLVKIREQFQERGFTRTSRPRRQLAERSGS